MISLNDLMKRTTIKGPKKPEDSRPPPVAEPIQPKSLGREYVATYQEQEIERYKRASRKETELGDGNEISDSRSHCNLSEVDTMTVGTINLTSADEETSRIYKDYEFDIRSTAKRLEVYQHKDEILSMIDIHNVVIIKGATGCGKSTQVPQFILENARNKNVRCNIVVTQPRRIAAVSVATRVAEERLCPLGSLVGYQIALDKKADEDTRILYVTTGVLLHKLIQQKQMKEFTHYIIDEIHERDQDMDFLLFMVREFLNTNSKETRLILMSATIDTTKFHDYLFTYYGEKPYKPGIIDIKNNTPYEVITFYLDDLSMGKNKIYEAASVTSFDITKPDIHPNAYKSAARIILGLDLLESRTDLDESSKQRRPGAVLVFLPGLHEIQTMHRVLTEMNSAGQSLLIKPLHSSITANEQREVFAKPSDPSTRKIILSTNIAESSVTVTDIEYVIDFCLTKVLVTDPVSGCTSLELAWASKNNTIQRAGRVGRVCEGRVYRMIPKYFYHNELDQEAVPEIMRCPLETLVLKSKLLKMGSPDKILALAMDQPNLENIHQAVARLKEMGALLVCRGDEYDPSDGDLTWLGEVIASLPLEVRLGKLIFLGCLLGVPEECITMACSMSTKNLFSTPYMKELEAFNRRLFWADSSCSDCIAFLNARKGFQRHERESTPGCRPDKRWAENNFLQAKVLREIFELEEDIKRRLKHHNLYSFERRHFSKQNDATDEKYRPFFLKLAIAGAFYPNYFLRGSKSQFDEKGIYTEVGGHDPFSTVYLQGLTYGEHNKIYKATIRKLFAKITDRLDVNMDNSSKAYVTFRRPLTEFKQGKIPGRVGMPVYQAIKMRQLGIKFPVPRLKPKEAAHILQEYEEKKNAVEDESKIVTEHHQRGQRKAVDSGSENNEDESTFGENESEFAENEDTAVRNEITKETFQSMLRKLIWPWWKSKSVLPNEILEVMVSHVESPERFWIQSPLKNSVEILRDMMKRLNSDQSGNSALMKPVSGDLVPDSIYLAQYGSTKTFHRCRVVGEGVRKNTYAVHFIDFGYSSTEVPANALYEMSTFVKRKWCYDRLPDFAVECSLVKIRPKSEKLLSEKPTAENPWDPKATNILKSFCNFATIAKVYSIVNDVLRVKLVHPKYKTLKYDPGHTLNWKLVHDEYAERAEENYASLLDRDRLKLIKRLRENPERDDNKDKKPNSSDYCEKVLTYNDMELPVNPDNVSETILKGPFSPLEMKVSSIVKDTRGKFVEIERDSVNSVLLDTDPTDPTEKMVVAAYVGLSSKKDHLRLRHTTIMPKFPALPTLCCLMFAPMVELRINKAKTKYCGALCGLGYNRKSEKSLYPANDIAVVFDYEINLNVLALINKIRFNLNAATDPEAEQKNHRDHLKNTVEILREHLINLLIKTDYKLLQVEYPLDHYRWGMLNKEKLMNPIINGDPARHPAEDFSTVHRLIWAAQLRGNQRAEVERLLRNLEKLKEFAEGVSSVTSVDCDLCSVQFDGKVNARVHLKTATHRVRLKALMKAHEELVESYPRPGSSTRTN